MRRTVWTLVLATLVLVVPAKAANAGGNWLGFREEPSADASADGSSGEGANLGTWAVMYVGQEVVAHTGIYVANPHRRERLETEGPFYAWLSPGDDYLDDTRLPADAIRLAPFTVRFTESNGAPVRAHFTVPAVPSGEYEVVVCNDPCTLSGFGEFVQGWVTIMQTPAEARLFELGRDRKWEGRELAQKVRRLAGELTTLEADLVATQRGARAADRAIGLLRSENDALRSRLIGLSGVREGVPAWMLIVVAFAFLGSASLLLRRRSSAFEIPDTVPDDLVERDRLGV